VQPTDPQSLVGFRVLGARRPQGGSTVSPEMANKGY